MRPWWLRIGWSGFKTIANLSGLPHTSKTRRAVDGSLMCKKCLILDN